jgi:putative flippase GtrA
MLPETTAKISQFLIDHNLNQIVRFIIVGIVNTGFSYLIYVLLLFVGLNFALANLGAVLIGILFSFRTQGAFVFGNTNRRLLGRFILSWLTIYLFTISIIATLDYFGIDNYTGGALALPASALASFFMQKFFVFRESPK